jgi:hypothetical protein
MYLMLPVSVDCQFLIAPSVFSNVYSLKQPFSFSFKSASSKWYTTPKHLNYNEVTWYNFLAVATFWCYLLEVSFEQANIIGVQWPFFECHPFLFWGFIHFAREWSVNEQLCTFIWYLVFTSLPYFTNVFILVSLLVLRHLINGIYLEIIFVLFSQQKQVELLLWENQ